MSCFYSKIFHFRLDSCLRLFNFRYDNICIFIIFNLYFVNEFLIFFEFDILKKFLSTLQDKYVLSFMI